jgi:thioredoxin-like negative regulator of GroEL
LSFWRKEVIEPALNQETQRHIDEQRSWIAREPGNALPYRNLAQLYRIQGRQEEALGLLLEAVRLDSSFGGAHAELAEIYAVRGDTTAAWRHARAAESNGDPAAAALLRRHGVPEETPNDPN